VLDPSRFPRPAKDAGWHLEASFAGPAGEWRVNLRCRALLMLFVYLCHPFLVHAAQARHGSVPRFMAQPPLEPVGDVDLDADPPSPVAQAILAGPEQL